MKQQQLIALIVVIAALGFIAYVVMTMPTPPAGDTSAPAATTTDTKPLPGKPAPKPAASGAAKPVIAAPAATTAPIAAEAPARLTVASKYPDMNYTPPTAVVTLSVTTNASAESQKGAYTVSYGDGTNGTFSLVLQSATTQTYRANDHVYTIPGTYTVTAVRAGTVIARSVIVVSTVQIAPAP